MEEQVAELAAEGLSVSKIATIIGASVAAIKLVLDTEDVQERVASLKALPKTARIDNQYDRIEKGALDTIETQLPMAEIPIAIKVLEIIQRKKQGSKPAEGQGNTFNFVNITMPSRLVPEKDVTAMMTNEQGEIVAIGERNFAALPTDSLQEKFLQMKITEKATIKAEQEAIKREQVDELFANG